MFTEPLLRLPRYTFTERRFRLFTHPVELESGLTSGLPRMEWAKCFEQIAFFHLSF